MEFKKGYFDSGQEYHRKRGLNRFRALISEGFLSRKSEAHLNLMFKEKWNYFKNCKKILDVGCGRGGFLSCNPYKLEAEGVDIIQREIDAAKQKGLNVKYGDITEKLPFKDDSFDGIFCSHVLEHLGDADKAFSEFKRVLKNEGLLVIAVPNFSFKKFYADPTHKRPYPKEALYRLFKDNGFEHVSVFNGVHLSSPVSGLFLFFPRIRFFIEKIIGKLSPCEFIAMGRNKK